MPAGIYYKDLCIFVFHTLTFLPHSCEDVPLDRIHLMKQASACALLSKVSLLYAGQDGMQQQLLATRPHQWGQLLPLCNTRTHRYIREDSREQRLSFESNDIIHEMRYRSSSTERISAQYNRHCHRYKAVDT